MEAGRGKHSPSHLGRGLGSWPNDMHRGLWALELGHGAFQGGPIPSSRWDEAGTRLGTQAWGHSCLPDRWDNNHKSLNPGVSIQYRLNKWSHSSQLLCSDTANEGKGDISEPGWEGLRKGGIEMKTKARAEDSLREGRGDSWWAARDRFWKLQSTLGRGGKRHGDRWPVLCLQQVSHGQGPLLTCWWV